MVFSKTMFKFISFLGVLTMVGVQISCSSKSPNIEKSKFASVEQERVFEKDFVAVWKAVEAALSGHNVVERDPEEVDAVEFKNLTERSLETDWIYSKSQDKYVTYRTKDKGAPKRLDLQTRYRFEIEAERVIGGVKVTVKTEEEIQKVKADGTPDGYDEVEDNERNSKLAGNLLDGIEKELIAAPNI